MSTQPQENKPTMASMVEIGKDRLRAAQAIMIGAGRATAINTPSHTDLLHDVRYKIGVLIRELDALKFDDKTPL